MGVPETVTIPNILWIEITVADQRKGGIIIKTYESTIS